MPNYAQFLSRFNYNTVYSQLAAELTGTGIADNPQEC